MAEPILDDALWQIIEPLLPPPKRRRKRFPGRKPLDDRAVLTGILFVLKTGTAWEDLPQEMGCGSAMTCWRRLVAWQKAGVWDNIHRALVEQLCDADNPDSSRAASADSTAIRDALAENSSGSLPQIAAEPSRGMMWQPTEKGFRLWRRSSQPMRTM